MVSRRRPKNNTSSDEITICNGVNLLGQNKECKPVNQDVEIFEIKQPLYSIGP